MPSLIAVVGGPAARTARELWSWWLSELRGFVPRGLAVPGQAHRIPRVDIFITPRDTTITREVDGKGERFFNDQPLEALDSESWLQLATLTDGARTRIIVSPPRVYTAPISLPSAARSRLTQAASFQLTEIAPLEPTRLIWTVHGITKDDDRLNAYVSMMRTSEVDSIAAQFEANGIPCPPVGFIWDDQYVALTSATRQIGSSLRVRASRNSLIALALLASVLVSTNLAAWLLTRQAEGESAIIERQVEPKLAIEDRARNNEALRSALAPVGRLPSVGRLLNEIANNLPKTAYVQSIELDGSGLLHMVVKARDPDLIRPALAKSPMLRRLHEISQQPTDDGYIQIGYRGEL